MEALIQFAPLLLLIVLMYFLMIRPQKKKDKAVKDMRNALCVGDEIVTIGGICGKIVKVKDESIIIQVGADKVKFEMMKWSVSSVTKESNKRVERYVEDESVEEVETKKMPKRLKKASDVPVSEEVTVAETPVEEAPQVEEAVATEEAPVEE